MEKSVIIVSAVVGSLGLLSAILGFSAEGTKLTPRDIVLDGDECVYPQSPAPALGTSAAVFLLVAQISVAAVGGCCDCCNKSGGVRAGTRRTVGILCAVTSWIAALIAWALLLGGAASNARAARVAAPGPECYYLRDGVFAGGAVLALAATALGVASYVLLPHQPPPVAPAVPGAAAGARNKPPGEDLPPAAAGIAMGHLQFPPRQEGFVQPHPPPSYPPQPQGYGRAQFPPPSAPPARN